MTRAEDQPQVRVIVLGSPHAGDDSLALELGAELARLEPPPGSIELLQAGRPGPGLVDLLDTDQPVLLLDVVRSGAAPGTVHSLELASLPAHGIARPQISSHGFGPAEALKLAAALGRALPRGRFVGIEGASFEVGADPSLEARAGMDRFTAAARQAIEQLREPTSRTGAHEHA